ncbi:YciI family protein [Breoghania sp. L-A4]|uniref:YciI family protein n=1 Tax=Breoghania sp. L-A4 TaxID=2304600 RepID=UPI000E358A62|nr:YciI family protein [Breoghania sp. L-A4]AXS42192.1 hypothetical protein D1F64_22055 [Breoghania sp. L-A4]
MYFLMVCKHHDGVADQRDALRPAHRAHVASGGNGLARVLVGSAVTPDDGVTSLGNFGILEAASEADARAFAETDPFARAGLVSDITITRLADTFQAHRIEAMTP